MEKMEIKEYLQELLDKWNKYDELDGFTADSFRNDLEKLLECWDLRIADNKEELDKAREEGFEQGYKEAKFDCEMGKEFSKESFKEVVSSVSSKLKDK